MHNELRYQAKTYTISEMLSKENKNSAFSPPNFFFFLKTNKQKNNKDMLMKRK
jgi:hypothetical protein